MPTTKAIFERIQEALQADPSRSGGLTAIYQFNLEGDDAGVYQINLSPGSVTVSEGEKDTPECTLSLTADDFKEMVQGNLNGTALFMSGRLRVDGDLGLAMRLESVLSAYSA
jgi:putative sterol carrier protein